MRPAGEMCINFVDHTIKLGDTKMHFRDEPDVPIVRIMNKPQARNPYPLLKAHAERGFICGFSSPSPSGEDASYVVLEDDDCDFSVQDFDELMCTPVDIARAHVSLSLGDLDFCQVDKIHRSLWHFDTDQMLKRYDTLLQDGKTRKRFRELSDEVIAKCEICDKHRKTAGHPKIHGMKTRRPNQLVCADHFKFVFKNRTRNILHFVDHWSKFSMTMISDGSAVSVIKLLRRWSAFFGSAPQGFLSDNGPEFDNAQLREFMSERDVRVYRTPIYTPRSAGAITA